MSLIKCNEPAKHTDKFDYCEDIVSHGVILLRKELTNYESHKGFQN